MLGITVAFYIGWGISRTTSIGCWIGRPVSIGYGISRATSIGCRISRPVSIGWGNQQN